MLEDGEELDVGEKTEDIGICVEGGVVGTIKEEEELNKGGRV